MPVTVPDRPSTPPVSVDAGDAPRCLSIRQPWAWAVCAGGKTIENRTWSTDYRGTLAIHASGNRQDLQAAQARTAEHGDERQFTLGAVIGLADVVDCRPLDAESAADPWAEGPYCWRLAHARFLSDPIPLRGRANLFALPADALARVRAQLHNTPPAPDPVIVQRLLAWIQPDRLSTALSQAAACQTLGRHAEMIDAASRALELDPRCGRAYWLRAIGLAAVREFTRALDDADQAVARGWLEVDEKHLPQGNLAAVHHAAECLRRQTDEAARGRADGHLRQFATIANCTLRDAALARRGYQAYRRFDPVAAIRAYATAGSAFDNLEDLTLLAQDASTAGLDAAELDHLRLAVLVSQSHQTKRIVNHVDAALDDWFA